MSPDAEARMYARGIIEFLDKRWTLAEMDAAAARRSLLLLSGMVVGLAVVAISIAVAAAAFVVLLLIAQDLLGLGSSQVATAVLAAVGAGGAVIALRVRRSDRGRQP
jgi:hypothetical protein